MSLLTREEREEMFKKKGTRYTNTEVAAGRTFGVSDEHNVDYFYQQEAPQLWNMIVNTNDNVEALAKGLHTLGKNDQVILDRIEEISDEIKQAQDAAFWKGKYYENTEEFNKMYNYLERIGRAIEKNNERLQALEKQNGKSR